MIRFPEGPQVCDFPHEASDREIGQTREGRSFLRVDAGYHQWFSIWGSFVTPRGYVEMCYVLCGKTGF